MSLYEDIVIKATPRLVTPLAIAPIRLNVGCGRDTKAGWVNLDAVAREGVDIIANLDACRTAPLPLEDDSVGEFLLSHVIEHIADTLPLMQELHRVAAPGAQMTIRVPYGSSDDAWEDPTHVRAYFLKSFGYFGQPSYWRADYGYCGDWRTDAIYLLVDARLRGRSPEEVMAAVRTERNAVTEMVATLTAVKPARAPRRDLQIEPHIRISFP